MLSNSSQNQQQSTLNIVKKVLMSYFVLTHTWDPHLNDKKSNYYQNYQYHVVKPNDSKRPKKWPKESSLSLPYQNAYYLVLESSLEASKIRSLCFVDKARFIIDLWACVVLTSIYKRAYALHSLSTKGALEWASEAFHLVASLLSHTLLFHFCLSFLGLGD